MITGKNLNNENVNNIILDGDSYEDYEKKVYNPIDKLVKKLLEKRGEIVRDLLDKDIIYQENKDKFTKEEIDSLFESMKDINLFKQYLLGINSNDDSIVTTLLNTTFQTNVQKTKQAARPLNKKLIELDEKLKLKKFSLEKFFERDNSGVQTGNLIHLFTKKYFKKLYEYNKANEKFKNATKDKKGFFYKGKIAWLKNNTHVIDFRKLSYFKDIYGEEYSEHFTFSDEEMTEYEKELKNTLGKLYDEHIQKIEKKLIEYENYKMNEEINNTRYKYKNIYSESPYTFVNNYYSDNANNKIYYDGGNGNVYETFNNSRYIQFIPKKEITDEFGATHQTGYYNSDFKEVENDEDAFEYWKTITELYKKHINPAYNSMDNRISSLSWAKFERSFSEEIARSKGLKGFFKTAYAQAIKNFRKLWYERGHYTDKSGVKQNYTDNSTKQVGKIKKILSLKSLSEIEEMADSEGIPYKNLKETLTTDKTYNRKKTEFHKKDLVDKIARKKVLDNYSHDLTKSTLALSELSTLHKARKETTFIAKMLLDFHKSIKTKPGKEGKDRYNSNSKVESWINININNKRKSGKDEKNSEEVLQGRGILNMRNLNDSEKELIKLINSIKKKGVDW